MSPDIVGKGTGTSVWGPVFWRFLRVVLETCSDEQAAKDLVPLITSFHALLPCHSCRTNFTKVLAAFPPDKYVTQKGAEGRTARLRWYDLVREEVRKHEPAKDFLARLRKHKYEIMRAAGFIVFLLIAALIGALILRRCQETGVVKSAASA